MSKKEPIIVKIRGNIEVEPDSVYSAEVIKSGNGAVIKSFKRYLGKQVIVIVGGIKMEDKEKKKKRKDGWTQEGYDEVGDLTELSHELNH